jgi:hypothetical protein
MTLYKARAFTRSGFVLCNQAQKRGNKTIMETTIELLQFCRTNTFNPDWPGTTITGIGADDFVSAVLDRDGEWQTSKEYPEICQHLFVENDFTTTLQGVVQVVPGMAIKEDMAVRNGTGREEKPFKVMWVDASDTEVPKAKYLNLILYSREHLANEGIDIESDWGVVTVLGVPTLEQTPPKRSTLERNAESIEAGGNGFDVTPEQYDDSDSYWYGQGGNGEWITVM